MTFAVIEINDSRLQISEGGDLLCTNSGYANFSSATPVFGADAETQAKLEPLKTTNSFWQHLSNRPAGRGITKTSAELAWLQLLDLWKQARPRSQKAVFVTPASFREDQLGILLGIAEHCPFEPLAVVDSALAAGVGKNLDLTALSAKETCLYVDIQLHSTLLTQIERKKDRLQRSHFVSLPIGITDLKDNLIKAVSRQFIRETRFDPLHEASTEQQLYNILDSWEDDRRRGRAKKHVSIRLGRQEHSLTIAEDRMQSLLAEIMTDYTCELAQHLSADSRYLVANGFLPWRELLPEKLTQDADYLGEQTVAAGVLRMANSILRHSSGVPMVTHFDCSESVPVATEGLSPSQKENVPSEESGRPPTHLLLQNQAFRLNKPLEIHLSNGQLSATGEGSPVARIVSQAGQILLAEGATRLTLNDSTAKVNSQLHTGDILAIEGRECRLIEVLN